MIDAFEGERHMRTALDQGQIAAGVGDSVDDSAIHESQGRRFLFRPQERAEPDGLRATI
jgi:hypothetical protein